ncbi:MAG: hypothetical protein AB7V47_10720 [Phycisphaerales bacterium]
MAVFAGLAAVSPAPALAQIQQSYAVGTGFTYQGRLEDAGQPAQGVYDIQFQLFNGPTFLNFLQSTVVVEDVQVTNGLFTTKVDFGSFFSGAGRWISVGFRPGASTGSFTVLPTRQELTPTPYAIGLALPYTAAYSSSAPLFTLESLGSGGVMSLTSAGGTALSVVSTAGDGISATTNIGHAINGVCTGAAAGLRGANSGTGSGVYGQISGASSASAAALYGYSLGQAGSAAFLRTEVASNTSPTFRLQNNGSGAALHVTNRTNHSAIFENTSAAGVNGGVLSTVAGGGISLWGKTTGSSPAARFDIDNPASTANALEVNNLGNGLTAKFNGGDVQVNGNLYAQTGTVLNRASPIAWGTFQAISNNPELTTSSGNVTVTYISGNGFRVQVVGEGDPANWTVIAMPRYGNNPDATQTEYNVKVGAPLVVIGSPGTGVFYISERCINGCNEFVPVHWINFVVYKGQ